MQNFQVCSYKSAVLRDKEQGDAALHMKDHRMNMKITFSHIWSLVLTVELEMLCDKKFWFTSFMYANKWMDMMIS